MALDRLAHAMASGPVKHTRSVRVQVRPSRTPQRTTDQGKSSTNDFAVDSRNRCICAVVNSSNDDLRRDHHLHSPHTIEQVGNLHGSSGVGDGSQLDPAVTPFRYAINIGHRR